jgi:hypothetical protein
MLVTLHIANVIAVLYTPDSPWAKERPRRDEWRDQGFSRNMQLLHTQTICASVI